MAPGGGAPTTLFRTFPMPIRLNITQGSENTFIGLGLNTFLELRLELISGPSLCNLNKYMVDTKS